MRYLEIRQSFSCCEELGTLQREQEEEGEKAADKEGLYRDVIFSCFIILHNSLYKMQNAVMKHDSHIHRGKLN